MEWNGVEWNMVELNWTRKNMEWNFEHNKKYWNGILWNKLNNVKKNLKLF